MPYRGIQVVRATERGAPNRVELIDIPDEELDSSELGEVLVDVEYSSLNYKDGLALTGRPGVVRPERLTAGIDLVGVVRESSAAGVAPGDRVLVNGCGLSETHPGGLAERARVRAEWVVPVPERFSARQAAAVGTAGYTAALCVLALEKGGLGAGAEVVVTGATGGVGTVGILLGAAAGWRVSAITGRAALGDALRRLGAVDVLDRAEFVDAGKPLQSARWDGAIDTVGGDILANVISQLRYGGVATACGLAASASLHVSMMPFILRSAMLAGVNSVDTPRPLRLAAWERLDRDLDLAALDGITEELALDEAAAAAARFFEGGVLGRLVVDVRR